MDDPANIRLIPPQMPDPQFLAMQPEWFIEKFVKLGFPTDCENHPKENMWVQVTGLAGHPDEELHGVLNNDPAVPGEWNRGDAVEFKRSEILQVMG